MIISTIGRSLYQLEKNVVGSIIVGDNWTKLRYATIQWRKLGSLSLKRTIKICPIDITMWFFLWLSTKRFYKLCYYTIFPLFYCVSPFKWNLHLSCFFSWKVATVLRCLDKAKKDYCVKVVVANWFIIFVHVASWPATLSQLLRREKGFFRDCYWGLLKIETVVKIKSQV